MRVRSRQTVFSGLDFARDLEREEGVRERATERSCICVQYVGTEPAICVCAFKMCWHETHLRVP